MCFTVLVLRAITPVTGHRKASRCLRMGAGSAGGDVPVSFGGSVGRGKGRSTTDDGCCWEVLDARAAGAARQAEAAAGVFVAPRRRNRSLVRCHNREARRAAWQARQREGRHVRILVGCWRRDTKAGRRATTQADSYGSTETRKGSPVRRTHVTTRAHWWVSSRPATPQTVEWCVPISANRHHQRTQ